MVQSKMLSDPLMSSPPDFIESPAYNDELQVNENFSFKDEYAYLHDLRSEDLVPLLPGAGEVSQSISEYIDHESVNATANINQVLPDLEEHDKGGVSFELNLMPQQKNKVNWFYSKDSNKVYIKLNENFEVEVLYKPRSAQEKMFVRSMMVFNKYVSEPVVRCENHSSKDKDVQKNIKHSVLRCENPYVIYEGTVEGKNISDRLSVRIPLGCVQPNEDDFVKQTVALKFVCQNSCVSRKETSIIFYLENAYGEILAKRVTNVKICSCPKRDMRKDEESLNPRKRTRKDECPVGKKILKIDSDIKVEPTQEQEQEDEEEDSFSNSTESNDMNITPNGVRITMDVSDIEVAHQVFDYAFCKVTGQMAMKPENAIKYSRVMKSLKKSLIKSKRLLNEQQQQQKLKQEI